VSSVRDALTRSLADRYRIEREIGAGGMATVYLAHDLKHDRPVAIKVLREELGATVGPERFLAEIRTTARLQHPHILPLLDSGEEAGVLYYVMPFVEGESLRDRLRREQQLSVEETVRLTREIADALHYAHERGIVHRDIKPENILLQGGHALVADFGIALALENAGGARLTQSGVSIGTPQYMSPEQAMGDRSVDARADQYALGAIAYEMLAGAPPFTGPTAQAIVARKLVEPPPSLAVVRPAAGQTLEQVVRRALATVPADRYEHLQAFTEALGVAAAEASARSAGTQVASNSGGLRVSTPSGGGAMSRRWWIGGVGIAAVALVGIVSALWRRDGASEGPALLRVTIPTGVLSMARHGTGSVVAVSPDGRTLAYLSGEGNAGQLMLRRLDAATATPVPGAAKAISPFFSPDGQWIGYAELVPESQQARLKKRHLVDGTLFDLGEATGLHGAAWTKDGRIILGGTRESNWGISVIPEDGGAATMLARPDNAAGEAYLLWPTLTPDGDHLVFTRAAGTGVPLSLELLDLRSGQGYPLLKTHETIDGGGNAVVTEDGILVFAADGAIFGAELDVKGHRLRGAPVRLVPDVLTGVPLEPALGHFAMGSDGTLAYVAGSARELGGHVVLRWEDSVTATPVMRARRSEAEGGRWLTMGGTRLVPGADAFVFFTDASERNPSWVQWYVSAELMEADARTGIARRLAPPRSWNPVPTADGEWIFTNRVPPDRFTSALYRQRRGDGGSLERLTADQPGALASAYSVTGDGKQLFYIQTDTTPVVKESDIYTLAVNGDRTPRPVLVRPGVDAHPAVSPDGRWLAWTSGGAVESIVHVAPYPAMTPQLALTVGLSSSPAWSRDGKSLYFIDRKSLQVKSSSFVGGPTPRIGAPRAVSGRLPTAGIFNVRARPYDVDAQGRVYTLAPDVARDTLVMRDLTVLVNWGTRLRAAVRR
jgi:serine/threonine-protein kinase